ncbi:MAG: glycosyltransferase family A protein [Eggerthellaceae bacterium]
MKISIIVPVYNTENTLQETLDSLIEQTHKDIEIICIDDGSSDGSPAILADYKKRHPALFTIISQENKGLSATRNQGISAAKGEILMFVDSDDMLVPHACEKVNKIMSASKAEVFTFGFKCFPETLTPLGMKKELRPPNKQYVHYKSCLLFKDKARPYAWRAAVRKSFLLREGIFFDEKILFGEDQVFFFLVYPLSRKTVLSPDQLYLYRMRPDSLTHTQAERHRLDQHRKIVSEVLYEWKSRNLSHLSQPDLLDWIIDFLLYDANRLPPKERIIFLDELVADLASYYDRPPIEIASSRTTRHCLNDIYATIELRDMNPLLQKAHFAAFYLKRYGLTRCVQQVLVLLGILKKWR